MERTTFIRKELGDAYNNDIINVAIDIDSSNGKLLQKTYPINATPTLFFFNADGKLFKKIEGATSLAELLELKKALANSQIRAEL